MIPGPPIATATKAEVVADRLTTAIAVGSYSAGDRLPPERELAASLGVSRVTVREAIRLVSAHGLLVSRRGAGGGTFVTGGDDWDRRTAVVARRTLERELPRLREFTEYRCLIAGLIARTAAQRCSSQDARILRQLLAEFDDAPDLSAARVADARLHDHVDALTGNERLVALSQQLSTEATLGFNSEPYPAEFLARARHEHHDIVDAVTARDAERAFQVAHDHYRLTLDILEVSLQRAGGKGMPR